MRHWARQALALGIAWAIATPSQAAPRRYAVVIGNNAAPVGEAGRDLGELRFADDDALRYDQLFEQFTVERRLLTVIDATTRRRHAAVRPDAPPTLAALRRTLAELAEAMRRDAARGDEPILYVVFSGHGAVGADGEAFLSLLDAELSRTVLFDELLGPMPADTVHLFVDACHAAGVVGLRGGQRSVEVETAPLEQGELDRWVRSRTLSRFPHIGVMVSSTAGEQAHEWSALEAGVFTHEVLSGLWGGADINGDLRIEYSEVQAFVASANRTIDDPRAAPQVIARPPSTDPHVAVVDLTELRESMWLTGDAAALGHFYVEFEDGQRHVDGNLSAGAVHIAVPAGKRAFLRVLDREVAFETLPNHRLDLQRVAMVERSESARGSAAAAFRRGLFAESYSRDYYRGFVDSAGAVPVRFDAAPRQPPALVAPRPPVPKRDAFVVEPTDDEPRPPRKRVPAARIGGGVLLGVGVASGIAAVTTGAFAGIKRRDLDATDIERDAHELSREHRLYTAVAISSAVVAGVAIIVGSLLVHRAKRPARGRDQ